MRMLMAALQGDKHAAEKKKGVPKPLLNVGNEWRESFMDIALRGFF
jgi:hypothetical protein